jgi:thioredoxin
MVERRIVMSVLTITKNNFESEVTNSDKPVLLDFWASWCGPCKMISPIVDSVADETKGSVKVGKINIDEETELAQTFKVMSIPTLIVLKDGKVVDKKVGVQPKQSILAMVQ